MRSAAPHGTSENLIVSHYENNYGGAVRRLNQIVEYLGNLDFAKAPGFVLNASTGRMSRSVIPARPHGKERPHRRMAWKNCPDATL